MLRCNQIVTGLESVAEGLTVNVADTGSPGRGMAGRMVQQVPGALLRSPSHPQQKENSEGKFPNSPEKLSDGMNEKLMWVINIVGENAPDSLKDEVQGEAYRCGGKGFLGGERRREWDAHRGFRGATPSIWGSRVLGEAAAAQRCSWWNRTASVHLGKVMGAEMLRLPQPQGSCSAFLSASSRGDADVTPEKLRSLRSSLILTDTG